LGFAMVHASLLAIGSRTLTLRYLQSMVPTG
jgi:hypothetical protein